MLSQNDKDGLLKRYAHFKSALDERAGKQDLLVVSKNQSADHIAVLAEAGQRAFAENYWQEAEQKIQAQGHFPLQWHFIGRVQRNKAAKIAAHFDWVHSLDDDLIAQSLSRARVDNARPLNVCIQVNISHEDQKGGIEPDDLFGLADKVAVQPHLLLRGLMVIPSKAVLSNRAVFEDMHSLWVDLQQRHPSVDTLSMGMSADYLEALDAGATMVRIGRGIFGERSGG